MFSCECIAFLLTVTLLLLQIIFLCVEQQRMILFYVAESLFPLVFLLKKQVFKLDLVNPNNFSFLSTQVEEGLH